MEERGGRGGEGRRVGLVKRRGGGETDEADEDEDEDE